MESRALALAGRELTAEQIQSPALRQTVARGNKRVMSGSPWYESNECESHFPLGIILPHVKSLPISVLQSHHLKVFFV